MYVLSREDGLTPVRERPAWEITRPRIGPRDEAPIEVASRLAAEESAILDQVADLDGSLALLQSPLGAEVAAGGLVIRLGAGYTISLLKGGINGILLHNVPAGKPLGRGRIRREMAGNRSGGRGRAGDDGDLRDQPDRLPPAPAAERAIRPRFSDGLDARVFSDLEVEEMFLAEDRDTLRD